MAREFDGYRISKKKLIKKVKKARKLIKKKKEDYMCCALQEALEMDVFCDNHLRGILPEYFYYKPKNAPDTGLWFKDNTEK